MHRNQKIVIIIVTVCLCLIIYFFIDFLKVVDSKTDLYFDKPWTETRDLLVEQGFKEELDKDHHLLYLRKDTESYIIDFEKDTTHSITHYYLGNSKIVNGIYYLWVQNLKSHGFKLSTDKEYEFEHYTARIYVSDTNDGLQMLGLIIEH